MAVDTTSKPVPNSSYEVAESNLKVMDNYINSTSGQVVNRAGKALTPLPLVQDYVEALIDSTAWVPVSGSFQAGGLIEERSQVLLNTADNNYYSWGGGLPKIVAAGSTPATSGGIGLDKWVLRGDSALRSQLADVDSEVLIGGIEAGKINKVVAGLKELQPIAGVVFTLKGFYVGSDIGGGQIYYDPTRSVAEHNGGTVIAAAAIAVWDGTSTDIVTLLNWTGSGSGCFVRQLQRMVLHPFMFGATNGINDDAPSVNATFNAAAPIGVVDLPEYIKIVSGPLYFRNGVVVNGNYCFVLNYSEGDACVPHPADQVIRSKVSGINIRYRDYMTPRNPYIPPYYINREARLGNNMRWTHLDTFTGDGFKYSSSGRFFLDLQDSTCFHHRYGTHMLGWTIKLKNVRCDFNFIGHFGSSGAIDGVRMPVHNLQFVGCHATGNTQAGVRIMYADGVDFGDLHVERNGVNNLDIQGLRGYKSGSMYMEYALDCIYSFNNVGGELNGFYQGERDGYKKWGKHNEHYYEIITTSSGQSVTVPSFDSVTKLGIDNFSAINKDDVVVILNETYIPPSAFSKSGSVITVPTSTAGQTLRVLAYPFNEPWTPTTTKTNSEYLLGAVVPIRLAHTRDLQFSGFVQSFAGDNTAVNDFDLANVEATKGIYYDAYLRDTTKVDIPPVHYPWGAGFTRRQDFYKGFALKDAFDGGVNTSFSIEKKYPLLNQVREFDYPDAAKTIFMITGEDGAGMFTIDSAGNMLSMFSSSNKYTFSTTDAAQGGKLNFYSGTPNKLRFNNLLGYATGYNLILIKDNTN